jgi:hypothetical protein
MGSNLVLTWLPADSTLAPPVPVKALSSLMLAITVGVTDIIGARSEVQYAGVGESPQRAPLYHFRTIYDRRPIDYGRSVKTEN